MQIREEGCKLSNGSLSPWAVSPVLANVNVLVYTNPFR